MLTCAMMRWPTIALFAALLVGHSACGGGKLIINLDRPIPELDPMQDPRLAKFSLRVVQAGVTTDQDAFRGEDADLLVGQVPANGPFDLRLAGKSTTDDMLGLGLVLEVGPISGESTISVKFRKPIGFVAGGSTLQVMNAAGDEASIELAPVAVNRATNVVATPNGVWLLAVAGNKVIPVLTKDHAPMESASLDADGTCIAASPKAPYAVVCHGEGGVSVVPLDPIGGPNVRGRYVAVPGHPTQVAFGANERRNAWVLLDGIAPGATCTAQRSTLVELDIVDGKELRRIALDRPVGDLAVDGRDGTVLLSLPCEPGGTRLGWLDASGIKTGPVAAGAHDLVLTDRGLIVIGSSAGDVKVQAQIFDLSKGGLSGQPQTRDYPLPPLALQFVPQAATAGFFAWISEPQQLRISDVAVAPDGRRAIVLFSANYKSDMPFGSCSFAANVDADGYLLLDLAGTTILLQRYTRLTFRGCSANCLKDHNEQSMSFPDVCAAEIRSLMQKAKLLLVPEFVPSSTALLFGGS